MLYRKFRSFFQLNSQMKLLILEAFMTLGWARLKKRKNFAVLAPTLGMHMNETSLKRNTQEESVAKLVSKAIHIASPYTFWESECLVKAIAGMKMLEKRNIESTLYLGMAKDDNGLIAHAWLRTGNYYISGAKGMEKFTVVARFAKRLKRKGNIMEKILDLSKVPKEVLLILELLKEERDIVTQKRLANEVDWQLFIDYTVHHRVYPLLYQELSKFDEPLVPDFVLSRLKQLYQKNTLKMLKLTGEMSFINSLLHQNEIQAISLKGPILANDLYGDISLRTSGDLDFLIPINQLDNTERILIDNGYIKKDDFSRVFNDWKFRNHHVTFTHPIKKTTLEIHWKLHPGPTQGTPFQDLWERKKSDNICAPPIHHLGKEDLLQYLIVHGSRHGWYRLRWLVDIQKFISQYPYQDIKNLFSKKNRYKLQFNQTLILLNGLLTVNLIEKELIFSNKNSIFFAQKSIFYLERMDNIHSPNCSIQLKNYQKEYKSSQLMLANKLLELSVMLYPSSNDLMTLKLPRYLQFLYFPLRPFLIIYRRLRKPFVGDIK